MNRKRENARKPLKILIADDHLVVRMGLSALISFESDMTVIGYADNGENAVAQALALRPDLVIMDIMMPKLNGAEATRLITAATAAEQPQHPGPDNPAASGLSTPRILILTTFSASDEVRQALEAGAAGAIVKDSGQDELLSAIRAIAAGQRVISPEIEQNLALPAVGAALSVRQREVLEYIAKGLSNPEIGKLLGIGPDCVKAHLKTVYAKLGVSTRTEAVAVAVNRGMIAP